jgi:hypothetical protein
MRLGIHGRGPWTRYPTIGHTAIPQEDIFYVFARLRWRYRCVSDRKALFVNLLSTISIPGTAFE